MNRADLLSEALQLVTKDREAQHGTPAEAYTLLANLWSVALSHGRQEPVKLSARDVMLLMVLLKAARCMSGGSTDSWVDIAGYAALGVEMPDAK